MPTPSQAGHRSGLLRLARPPRPCEGVARRTAASASAGRCASSCCQTASSSAATPSPVTAEMAWTGQRERGRPVAQRGQAGRGRPARRSCWPPRSAAGEASAGVEQLQLVPHGLEVVAGIAARRRRHVHQVDQHLRPLDVAQELVAEAVARVRAFDQAGHVGHHEAAVVAQRDDAEVRRQRRERVVGDLGPRRRDARDQRGLARVGEPDQADVGEQLQLQAQVPRPRPARPARRAAGRDWSRWRTARCRVRRGRRGPRARAGRPRSGPPAAGQPWSESVTSCTTVPDRHLQRRGRRRRARCGWSPGRARRARRGTRGGTGS